MNRCGGGKRRVGIDSATHVVAATLSSKGLHWRGGAADRHGSPNFLNPSPTIQTWSPISATQHSNRRRHSRRHGHKPASRAHAQTRTSDVTPTRAAYTPTRVFPSNGPQIQTTLECSIPDCHTQVCNILSHNTVGQKSQARSTTLKIWSLRYALVIRWYMPVGARHNLKVAERGWFAHTSRGLQRHLYSPTPHLHVPQRKQFAFATLTLLEARFSRSLHFSTA